MENWDLSLPVLGYFTQYATAELAVRPFLTKDPKKVMAFMMIWAKSNKPKIRSIIVNGIEKAKVSFLLKKNLSKGR